MSWQETKFGANIVTKDGTVPTKDLKSLTEADVVAVYFSAHWCPPCRGFTPNFAKVYNELKAQGKKFECVFASSDRSASDAGDYFKEMPWTMLPFADRERKNQLSQDFGVQGIPMLILLDGKTGEKISSEGRKIISDYGAPAFPFSADAIAAAEAAAAAAKNLALVELKGLLANTTAGAAAIAAGPAHIAFWFSQPNCRRGSTQVQPKIKALASDESLMGKLVVLHVPSSDASAGEIESWSKQNAEDGCGCITAAELAENGGKLQKAFKNIFEPVTPHVGLIACGDAFTIVHDDCVRQVYNAGAEGYPWTPERMAELEAVAKAKEEAMKKGLAEGGGFGFLGDQLLTKEGLKDTASVLGGAEMVGLYFSAHWCPPCRGYTPDLGKKFKALVAAGKKVKIVFVSSDRDEGAFNEYYNEMPWVALPFAQRDLKESLSGALGVRGIPSLILLDGKTGKVLTKEGRAKFGDVQQYPWGVLG